MKWAGGAVVLFFGFFLAIVLGVAMAGNAAACGGGAGTVNVQGIGGDARVGSWGSEQLTNAAHIMNAASAMGLSVKAQQIGVMTAMGEASLVNIGYGDWETGGVTNPDGSPTSSIGLFQQQEWWGSRVDRLNPEKAATMFFNKLQDIPGWEQMDPSRAAHEVQVNADPAHYTKWWDDAVTVTDELARRYAASGQTACTSGEATYPLDQPYMMTDDFGPRETPTEGASSWHPAIDLVGACGDPVYAVLPGKVVASNQLYLSVQSPDGFLIEYLHTHKADRAVNIGDEVLRGQQISKVGNEGPSTGCHLDLRIDVSGNKNPKVAQLQTFPEAPGYVNPEDFFPLYGLDICPTEWCRRNY